jgi:head-tail adaptor
MNAGELNCWVVIEAPAAAPGAAADAAALVWTRVCGAWAKLENRGGLELAVADQMESRLWWVVTIRKLGRQLAPNMRVNLNGRILNITAIADVLEENCALQLTCWEGHGIL